MPPCGRPPQIRSARNQRRAAVTTLASYGEGMTEPDEDVKRLEEQSGGYGGPGVEAEESPEQRAADRASAKVTDQEEADSGEDK